MGRQENLDLAKGLVIAAMMLTHILEEVGDAEHIPAAFYNFMLVINVFIAPVFMLCMGIGQNYSRNQSCGLMAKRGAWLWVLGVLLNALTWGLIEIIHGLKHGAIDWAEVVSSMFDNDILLFAGIALMLTALLKRLRLDHGGILVVAAVLSLVGTWMKGWCTGHLALDIPLSYVWGLDRGEGYVWFPLCHWYIFVAVGLCLGRWLRHVGDRDKFWRYLGWPMLVVGSVYYYLSFTHGFGILEDHNLNSTRSYMFMNSIDHVFCLMSSIGFVGVLHFVAKVLCRGAADFLSLCARNLFEMYFLHWLLIAAAVIAIEELSIPSQDVVLWQKLLLWGMVYLVSFAVAHLYRKSHPSITHVG